MESRQWDLYNYLKDNYRDGYYISKTEIAQAMPQHYKGELISGRIGRSIERDVREINNDDTIQKIIVSNRRGYKIGNIREVNAYLSNRFVRDLKSLKLNWKLSKKASLDKQMRLVFGSERDTVWAFMEVSKDEQ